jgi:hypothetical protein
MGMGIRFQVDLEWHQDPDDHIIERYMADQFDQVLRGQYLAQRLEGGWRHSDLLRGFGGVAHDGPLRDRQGRITVPGGEALELLGPYAEALCSCTVMHHCIRARRQVTDRQDRQLPQTRIELGRLAQPHPELDEMAQQGQTVRHHADNVVDAATLRQNLVKKPPLALGELITIAIRQTCHTRLLSGRVVPAPVHAATSACDARLDV